MQRRNFLWRLARASDGTMAIETAFVAPVLVVMCLGGFEASRIVSRNTELRTALAEAGDIAIASPPDSQERIDAVEDIVEASTDLDDGDVTVTQKFRCDNDDAFVEAEADCGATAVVSSFLEISVADTYDPAWTEFGIGEPIALAVTRTVQVS
jgi:Flp pilus assembly protein TadG